MARKVNTSDSNITDGGKSAGANKNETITSTKTKSNQTVTGKRNGSKSVQTEPVDYFKAPNPIWYIIMLPPIIYCTLVAYAPDLIPFDKLGSLGKFTVFLLTNHKIIPIIAFWTMVLFHFVEAIYVVRIANKLNINTSCKNKWFFYTLLIGFPSIIQIKKYYRSQKNK